MKYLICLVSAAAFIQVATSQILSNGLQNNIQPSPNLVYYNSANGANIANAADNFAPGLNPNIAAGIINNNNQAAIQAANLQSANLQALYNEAANFNNANFAAVANANNRYANIGLGNIVNNNGLGNIINNNGLANANLARYTVGGVNGQLGPQAYGISIAADALEVGGQLAVNGRVPFYSAVAVNSQLPIDGSAVVNYSCGRPGGY